MSWIDEARAWLANDPDPDTREELERLIEDRDLEGLEERFAGPMEFGTAGLRGLLGAGPARMNRVTVSRATAGLCAWLTERIPDARTRGICIGRDARPKSDVFERDVIEVATAAGIPVAVFTDVVPTPVLAFSVLRTKAAGGVMITASHNPPGYNGFKVYWENGAQIIPPNDSGIADRIAAAAAAPIARLSVEEARAHGLVREIDSMQREYVETVAGELGHRGGRASVRIAYTALHGVAERTFRNVMAEAGFDDVCSVEAQSEPDGSFPTVAFPNPEEPGAMDQVLELAEEIGADLVLANDPDGDRLAAGALRDSRYELLSGNDIGILLADWLLRTGDPGARRVVLSTIVSSPMLGPVARSHGARWEQTPTGHKWIQNRALELEREGHTCVFSYEEALGYATSSAVRDKDGISAAVRLADMAAELKERGQTLIDALDLLFVEHGFVADAQVSVRFEGPSAQLAMRAAVERVVRDPPRRIGGQEVLRTLRPDPDVVVFELEGGHRAMLRPSGTEPKLKHYVYAVGKVEGHRDLDATKVSTRALLERIVDDLTRATRA